MPELNEVKILPYKAKDIYDLVVDVDQYSQFLPWCKKSRVVERIGGNNLQADLVVHLKAFSEKYRSDVKFYEEDRGVYIVESRAISGPFKDLHSRWKITADKDENGNEISCVEFFISFQFNSFFLDKMIGGMFEKVSRKMISSFEERARVVLT